MKPRKLTAIQASDMFYNLFFKDGETISIEEYLENSFFDVAGYIDLNKNEYRITYHVKNKFLAPPFHGQYQDVINFMVDNCIHPDDKYAYKNAFEPDHILKTLEEAEHPHFHFFHHRFKLQDGTYRWVEQALITGEEFGLEKGIVKFYIYDIQNIKSRELGDISDDKITNDLERDDITGLYVKKSFYEQSKSYVEQNGNLCLISLDIQHFKLFSEWYGTETSNHILSRIGATLIEYVEENGGVAGYFGGDDFVLLSEYSKIKIRKFYNDVRHAVVSFGFSVGFLPAIGVCKLKDAAGDVHLAYEKAAITADEAKLDTKDRIHYYDYKMHLKNEKDYRTLIETIQAMRNDEITFYLQPQCRMSNKKIVGAEALARWVKKDGEIIPPGFFVPILEKYGFITDLDQYIWEKVFAFIKRRLSENKIVVPISINVSRVDLFTIDVVEKLKQLKEKYNIPAKYIKVEITESAAIEGSIDIAKLFSDLRKLGFTILMDDFGSGYSSLNMLSNLEVDVIKLDALFLAMKGNDMEKGMKILESIVNMAKTIGLPIIVEGVEKDEQRTYLSELGCRYSQGFYFYRPQSIEDFEKIIEDESIIDPDGFVAKVNDQFRLREFLDQNIYSDSMLNNILGAVAIYTRKGESVDIVRFNEQFYESVNVPDFHQRLRDIQRFVPEEDKDLLYQTLNDAKGNKLIGATGAIHFIKTDGTISKYHMHFYYLGEQNGYERYYGSVKNITELSDLQEQMSLLSKYFLDTIIFLKRRDGVWSFKVAVNGLDKLTGLSSQQLENELNDWSFFKRMKNVDEEILKKLALAHLENKEGFSYSFMINTAKNDDVLIHMRADPVNKDEANNVEYILAFSSDSK